MRRTPALLAVGLITCACVEGPVPGAVVAPVIFGADDRVEVHEVVDATLRDVVVRAMPAMIHQRRLGRDEATGALTLDGPPLGERRGLCEGEAFVEQPTAASCSATLIDDDLVLTAGHCVDSVACADQRYVFGWYYEAPGMLRQLEDASVYACAEIVASELSLRNDYAVVRLERDAVGPPVEVRREPVVPGERVSLAGYPLGIPMKVVEAGEVTGPRTTTTFYALLDAHPGNSGSGVLDAEHRVVGKLTAGPVGAFEDGGTCTVLRVIGEDTEVTETINSVIPAIEALCASGFESERLCPRVCGDGACDAGEACPADCGVDGAVDGGVDPEDASAADDGSIEGLPEDAGPPALPPEGCSCRTAGAPGSRAGWALALLALVGWMRRRRRL